MVVPLLVVRTREPDKRRTVNFSAEPWTPANKAPQLGFGGVLVNIRLVCFTAQHKNKRGAC
jgi:hypothetical protein